MTNTAFDCPIFNNPRALRSVWRKMASSAALGLILAAANGSLSAAATSAEPDHDIGTYLSARLAQDLRDTTAASTFLKTALDRDPGNAALLDQAFIAEVMDGNWAKAIAYATRAIGADPSNNLAHLVLGVDAFKAGRLAEADKHFAIPGSTPISLLSRAWVMTARKDSKGAAQLLNQIKDTNWVGFFRKLQGALMADVDGDSATAGKTFEELFKTQNRAIDVTLAYAMHLSHGGDQKQAADIVAQHFAAATQHHPLMDAANTAISHGQTLPLQVSTSSEGLASAFSGFAQALQGQGGVDLAMIYTRLSLELRPNDQLTQFSLAEILDQVKKYNESIDAYGRIPDTSPLHFDAKLRQALNLNALDKTDQAKAALLALTTPVQPAAETAPAALHSQIEDLAGVSEHEKGEKVRVLQHLLARAGLGDGGADGNFGTATTDAITQLQKDAHLPADGALNPATRKALEDRIIARPPEAALPLSNDRLIEVYSTIGRMLSGHKMFAEAADYFSKSIALIGKPAASNWDEFYSRAVAYERLNQWDKSEPDFLKALDLNPNEPLILNYLGYSWVDRNINVDKAVDLIKRAVSLKPDDGYYVDSLGWAYFRMGRFEDAVQQLERAVELPQGAGDPTINDHLGDAYWHVGRKLEAQFQWSTALTYKPEAADIPRIQDKLKNGLGPDTPAATTANSSASAPAPAVATPPAAGKDEKPAADPSTSQDKPADAGTTDAGKPAAGAVTDTPKQP